MKKKIISLLLALVMLFSMIPLSAITASAEEEKTIITEVRATYDFVVPTYAQKNERPNFTYTITNGVPVTLNNANCDWYLWYEENWEYYRGRPFVNGTWCHDVYIYLNDTTNYEFAPDAKLYINDVEWGTIPQNYYYVKSPSFNIDFVEGLELKIYNNLPVILDTYINKPYSGTDIFHTVTGGTQPYTFSKASGPAWLQVSADGKITGTPTVVGENEDLVVKVTDAAGAEVTASMTVYDTHIDPADREVISRVVATVEIPELYCGMDAHTTACALKTSVTEGAPARLETNNSDFYIWRNESGTDYYQIYRGSLYAESYAVDFEVKLGSSYGGHTHVLDKNNLEVTVNGEDVDIGSVAVYNDSSYVYVKLRGLTVNHIFDNETDATCNGCDFTREGCDHQYDSSCDDTCNVCSATRAVPGHTYTGDCDTTCNNCGGTRETTTDHTWSSCTDQYCNVCNFYRSDAVHVWDSCLDNACNRCNQSRDAVHIYDNGGDTICNVCEKVRPLPTIQPGVVLDANITEAGDSAYYLFTPPADGQYIFYSESANGYDTWGAILGYEGDQLAYNDDNGSRQFGVKCDMTAGTTYVLRARLYNRENIGNFTVKIHCVECTYDHACDTDCNVCGAVRVTSHAYDDNCDADCNVCSDTREAPHKYDNCEDAECNDCDETRTPLEHIYDNVCDATCNTCNKSRTVEGHTYDDSCDDICNNCSETRVPPHSYSDMADAECDSCGEERTLNYIGLNETVDVVIPAGAEKIDFVFTPTVTATYKFYSHDKTGGDPYGYIYRADGTQLGYDDDGNGSNNFKLSPVLNADTTYILRASVYGKVNAASYKVTLDCGHAYTNVCDVTCDACGNTREVEGHEYDSDCDTNCNKCDETRVAGEHTWSYSCDTVCDECGATRDLDESLHVYDDDCDEECNNCSTARTAPHVYTNACDTTCNECDNTREVGDHIFENEICTICGAEQKTKISEIIATSNIASVIGYGKDIKNPTISVTTGAPARYNSAGINNWYKYNETNKRWEGIPWNQKFTHGKYRLTCAFGVYDDYNSYKLAENVTITVDGVAWTLDTVRYEDTYCVVYAWSEPYIVECPHEYDNNCDISCNLCDEEREVRHHSAYAEKQRGQEKSCTVDGWKDYYKCSCNALYADEACTIKITDLEAWKIGEGKIAAGHIYGDLKPAQETIHTATVLKGAVDAHYFCDECDTYFDSNKNATTLDALTGDAPSHSGGTATCNAKAKCSVCGVDYGNLASHKFGGYVYNNDATSKKDGTKTRTCSVCKKTETITATGTKLKNPFKDVKLNQYYAEPVLWAVEKGITSGTLANTFSPDDTCTRAQVVTFLWRAAGSPEPTSTRNPFKDVKSNQYYYKAVLWAVEKGITSGTSANTFSPDDTCTRAQVVTFLWRAKGSPKVSATNPFKDVKKSYYSDAVLWAVKNKITTGTSATTFSPNATCTRGQIVTFLYKAYK